MIYDYLARTQLYIIRNVLEAERWPRSGRFLRPGNRHKKYQFAQAPPSRVEQLNEREVWPATRIVVLLSFVCEKWSHVQVLAPRTIKPPYQLFLSLRL